MLPGAIVGGRLGDKFHHIAKHRGRFIVRDIELKADVSTFYQSQKASKISEWLKEHKAEITTAATIALAFAASKFISIFNPLLGIITAFATSTIAMTKDLNNKEINNEITKRKENLKVSLDAYNRFVNRLKNKLYEIFKSDFDDLKLAEFFETSSSFFYSIRSRIKQDPSRLNRISENFLFDLLALAKVKIYSKSILDKNNYFDNILDILDIFSEYHRSPAFKPIIRHPLYLPLLALSRSLALIFYKAEIIDVQSVRLFQKKFKVGFSTTLSVMRSNPSRKIYLSKYAELYNRLKSNYYNELTEHNIYGAFTEAFDIFFAIASTDELVPLAIQYTSRGDLVMRLIDIFPQGSIKTRVALSLLLYKTRYDLFKSFFGIRVYTDPATETTAQILQNIEDLTVIEFEKITQYSIKKTELDSIKQKASSIIR